MTSHTKFNTGKSPFFATVKRKVDHYFKEHNIHPAGNVKLYKKTIFQAAMATALYIVLVFFTPSLLIAIPLCILLGFNLAVLGFNIMHEGGHQSFSKHGWINRMSAYWLNILGGNAYFWKIKHNINHHTYTNIEGMDSDINVKPFMRLHEGQPRQPYHRFQYLYWVVLYGVSYVAWVFYEDFQKYFSGKISASSTRKKLPGKEHAIFWVSKIFYVTAYIIVPIITVGWLYWLVGFSIVTFVCGVAISVVFQLAHVVEGTSFFASDVENTGQEWAVHQVVTTANFATSSKGLYWLLGGLNFQIEHHLFPRVSHIHYPAISRYVREVCEEYNVVYHENPSLFKAIVSHIAYLRRMGRADKINA